MDIGEIMYLRTFINNYEEKISSMSNSQELKDFIKEFLWIDINAEETSVLFEYSKSRDEKLLMNYVKQKVIQMPDEEKVNLIIYLCRSNSGMENCEELIEMIVAETKDKSKILERYWEICFFSNNAILVLNAIDDRSLTEYIKKNCTNNMALMDALISNGKIVDVFNQMNDAEKTILIIEYMNTGYHSIEDESLSRKILHSIKNELYRKKLIVNVRQDKIINIEDLKQTILEYQSISEHLEQIADEGEKTKFITNLDDNDLKLDFLKQITSKENRKKVIQSLDRKIEPRIEQQVELVKKMINEFFEDQLKNGLTEKQKEKLEIALAKTSVGFEDLKVGVNGIAYNLEDRISISTRHINNLSKTILYLIHEYGHIFSRQNLKTENCAVNDDVEEGMQDVFSELVVNHYIEKHGRIEMQGKKIRMDYPCKSYSCYDIQNSWVRTMLYPLQSQGKDIEAVTEYLLGDKNKFLELTLGKENADSKPRDLFGNAEINILWQELYGQMPEEFENSDETSIYCRRNNFLPIFKLQKRLEEKGVNFFELTGSDKYKCTYIAEKYFDNRKIYQISREEMAEFHDLCFNQNGCGIDGFDDFSNKLIDELSEDEIKEHSTEILDTSLALFRNLIRIGYNLENVWGLALKEERDKIENGQGIRETALKYRKLISDYTILLSRIKSDESEFLMDGVLDLKFAYLEQMNESIRNGNLQDLLEGLRNEEYNAIYADTDILALFETLGVKCEEIQMMGTRYKSQDIVDSAIRGKLKLDDVSKIELEIDKNDRNNELMGENDGR